MGLAGLYDFQGSLLRAICIRALLFGGVSRKTLLFANVQRSYIC